MDTRRPWKPAGLAMGCGAVSLASTLNAGAEVREAAEHLAEVWRAEGAIVTVESPRFLNTRDDDSHPLSVTLPWTRSAPCTTVALLGVRGFGFRVRLPVSVSREGSSERGGVDGRFLSSVAGALTMQWCGEPPEERFALESETGRGAVEMVVARSQGPLASLQDVLPERSAAISAPGSQEGTPPDLPNAGARASLAEARARLEGGSPPSYVLSWANSDGAGDASFALVPGCHRIELFPPSPPRRFGVRQRRLDLDAEMRNATDGSLLARDAGDAPDARLEQCVGEATPVTVAYVGSPVGGRVIIAHTRWRLPEHIPTLWGSTAVGRVAQLLRAHHVVSLAANATWIGQGGWGTSSIAIPVEPGACYLVVAPEVHGVARSMGLSILSGDASAFDDRGRAGVGAIASFCAGGRSLAHVQVSARGSRAVAWGLAVFRVSSGIWQASQ